MRISDWSSDVCSSDLRRDEDGAARAAELDRRAPGDIHRHADVAQGAHLFENLIALVEQLRAAGRARRGAAQPVVDASATGGETGGRRHRVAPGRLETRRGTGRALSGERGCQKGD